MLLKDLYKTALSKTYGRPYIWGADGPDTFDCSGLIRVILKPCGILPLYDVNADEIYRFLLNEVEGIANVRGLGALAFFGSNLHIHHVGFCLDEFVMLNAAGGGPGITTIPLAIAHNANVKIEPIDLRGDLVGVIMPPYAQHGFT